MYSIENFKEKVENVAEIIATSGLKDANEDFFNTLSHLVRDLNLKIISYENKIGDISREELEKDLASVRALFDFHMREGGAKEIANLQIKTIKENLENIMRRANLSNYIAISAEFDATIKLYNGILKTASDSNIIKELIARFRYQVFKYKLQEKILDDRININVIMRFIIEDIDAILADSKVSPAIKEELRKYALSSNLIREHFNDIAILINLGLTEKDASKEQVLSALSSTNYYESEIQKEYHEPSAAAIKGHVTTCPDFQKIFNYWPENAKEYVPALVLYVESRNSRYNEAEINNLLNNGFQDIKYFAEALIANGCYEAMIHYRKLFVSIDDKCAKGFDLAVMAYRDEIPPHVLANYIADCASYGKKFLTAYMFNTGKSSYLDTNFAKLPARAQIQFLECELNTHENEEEKLYLEYFKEAKYIAQVHFFKQVLGTKNVLFIINILNSLIDAFAGWEETFFFLLNKITEPKIKAEILEYYYNATKNHKNKEFSLICSILQCGMEYKMDNVNYDELGQLNIFEAYHYSSIVAKVNLLPLVKKFYKNKLDWHHILEVAPALEDTEFFTVVMYCYLGDREYFINNCEFSYNGLVPFLLKNIPESIVDLMCTLSLTEIANLDESLLEIFANNYEQQLAQAGLSLNDQFEIISSKESYASSVKGFLAYIMHRGLLTPEIMSKFRTNLFYKDGDVSKLSGDSELMLKAIKNAKLNYERPGFIANSLKGYPYCGFTEQEDFDFSIMFLTEKELNVIKNDPSVSPEVRELRLRKYYGDLLRLIGLVPKNIEQRIISQLARSNIEEYLMYIKANHPEYMSTILANLSDPILYQKLIGFDGSYTVDEALRIAEIKEGNPKR